MTARRALGAGPQAAPGTLAAEADLLEDLPVIRLPDLDDLRARGVLDARPATTPVPRRSLGTGGA
ncbi:hypothetical protein ACF1GS_18625 [Streptomyces eurythermus]|uniref:hypothetical protein n=1 Tax=Streptomyces eurythermus TaxID=42237 RepID=UPI00370329A1